MADIIEESIRLVVEEEERSGRNGKYKVKVVKYKNKTWTVGKKEVDKVDVGGKYTFKLMKNEYNDQIYYWANLVNDDSNDDGSSEQDKFKKIKKDFLDYFSNQSLEHQKKILTILLEKLG